MERYQISKEESEKITIIKTLLVILIVFIHANKSEIHFASENLILQVPVWLEYFKYAVSRGICRSAVPLYFLLSSILLYRCDFNFKSTISSRAKRLLVPYFVLNTVWIVVFYIMQNIPATCGFFASAEFQVQDWGWRDWINSYIGFTGYPMAYHLWFLRDLFALNCLSKVFEIVLKKFPKTFLFFVVLFWLSGLQTGIFFISREALVFWVLGWYIVKFGIHIKYIETISIGRLCFVYLGVLTIDLLTRNIFIGVVIHNFTILLGCVFLIRVFSLLASNQKIKEKIIGVSGYAFSVYLFHEYFLKASLKIGAKIFPNTALFMLLEYISIPFGVIVFCLMFSIVAKRFMPVVYHIMVGSK